MHSPRTQRPDAVIFDLDGTLVDTVPARIAGWRETLDAERIPITDAELEPMIGMDGRRLAYGAAENAGQRLTPERAEEIDRAAGARFDLHNRHPRPLPGVAAAIERLERAGIIWAIATSSRAEQVSGSLAALGLDHRTRVVDGSRVEHAKPAPDLLLLAAGELGVAPERAWYVGDSTWDMQAAVAAGMVPIGVLAGAAVTAADLRDAGAAVVLDTLDAFELPD